jgi:hypothetical protein
VEAADVVAVVLRVTATAVVWVEVERSVVMAATVGRPDAAATEAATVYNHLSMERPWPCSTHGQIAQNPNGYPSLPLLQSAHQVML